MLGNLHDFRTIRKALSLLQRLGKTPTPVFYVAYPELAEGKAVPFCRFDAHMLLRARPQQPTPDFQQAMPGESRSSESAYPNPCYSAQFE